MRLPQWLKIFIILVILWIVFQPLQAVSHVLIPLVLFAALMLFPGRDPENPRLVRWIPWLWGLSFIAAVVFLIAEVTGKTIAPAGAKLPTTGELWQTVVFAPILIFLLLKRHPAFKPVLIAASVVSIALATQEYMSGMGEIKETLEFFGELAVELVLAVYLLVKVKTAKTEPLKSR